MIMIIIREDTITRMKRHSMCMLVNRNRRKIIKIGMTRAAVNCVSFVAIYIKLRPNRMPIKNVVFGGLSDVASPKARKRQLLG